MSDTDTRYFDTEFTGESVELTPPDEGGPSEFSAIQEVDESFSQFSYQDPGSVMTTGSLHSRNSLPIHSEWFFSRDLSCSDRKKWSLALLVCLCVSWVVPWHKSTLSGQKWLSIGKLIVFKWLKIVMDMCNWQRRWWHDLFALFRNHLITRVSWDNPQLFPNLMTWIKWISVED